VTVRAVVRAGLYLDSIFLMQVSDRIARAPGIRRASAVMATPANKEALAAAGLADPALAAAGPDDLAVVVEGETADAADAAVERIDEWLTPPRAADRRVAPSLGDAFDLAPHASVVCISVPGEHAAAQAAAAVERGLSAFVFSSGVSVSDEVDLKRRAHDRGLIVMGPDCGTVMLGGAGLGFANAVRSGPIGVVGATGTGLQEIVTLIHRWGGGVSHAVGTGSHDLWDEVGGISTFDALDALARDPDTAVIVVASKPPGERTLHELLARIARLPKPTVLRALGAGDGEPGGAPGAGTLEDAAWRAFVLAYGRPPTWSDGAAAEPAPLPRLDPRQRWVRGLFSGGTLAAEADAILGRSGVEHTVVDLGAEELVQGKPHPMIDPGPRREQLMLAAQDPETGVVLLDIVIGYGAAADPAGDLAPAIARAITTAKEGGRQLAVVASITGSEEDPQVRSRQEGRLAEAGALVAPSGADAARLAACVVEARAVAGVTAIVSRGDASAAGFLRRPPAIITVGAAHFAASLREQGIEVVEVDWRPPPSDEVGRALEQLL
jgi:FdrA protein